MQPFEFEAAKDLQGAQQAHAKSEHSRFLAGGTTLIDLMKLDVETPDRVVDLNALPYTQITEKPQSIEIGSMVSNSDLAAHPLIKKHLPFLSQALLSGASPQLRNLATVGGNLLQRTRCAYFRDTACACNKREPNSGCGALTGFNRYHAVLGTSEHCIAAHPSDMCVPLAALEAKVLVTSAKGDRAIPFSNFYRKPGDHPEIDSALHYSEIITGLEVPKMDWYTNSIYIKVRDRASYAFALTSCAVALKMKDGVIQDARLALGGVATMPWRAVEAESALIGNLFSDRTAQAAADAALHGAVPYEFNAFKIQLAKRTIRRALAELVQKTKGVNA